MQKVKLQFPDMSFLNVLLGEMDSNVKLIENSYDASIVLRDNALVIIGDNDGVNKARKLIEELYDLHQKGTAIDSHLVKYTMELISDNSNQKLSKIDNEVIVYNVNGTPIKPKTLGQKSYIDAITNNDITICIGPAGTGKTYLAVAMAYKMLKNGNVNRIILTRPAVEAGESLGFLPGDLKMKVDPYLRPLYDALYDMMGNEKFHENMEKGIIEVAPLAFMRGRTLDSSFIILDEAQNTTREQMKMFLTRMGFDSKVVVTGDMTQLDLPHKKSGLQEVVKILDNIEGISIGNLTEKDVVRHSLVQKIIKAYEKYEENIETNNKKFRELKNRKFDDSRMKKGNYKIHFKRG